MTDTTAGTVITFDLPLPVDIFANLGIAIDKLYPGATVVAGGPKNKAAIRIPDDSRYADADQIDIDPATPIESDSVSFVDDLTAGRLNISVPEFVGITMARLAENILTHPDAKNYVELLVAGDSCEYAISVARTAGQTPHTLREAADARAARYAAKLLELGIDPDTV